MGEISAIANRLHCSTASVFGSDVHRLEQTARAALSQGMQVAIQPRLYDHSQHEVLAQLAGAAELAEAVHRDRPGAVTLIAGCEHILFTAGIVPGQTFLERIADRLRSQGARPHRLELGGRAPRRRLRAARRDRRARRPRPRHRALGRRSAGGDHRSRA
jgi:hypothetical protein